MKLNLKALMTVLAAVTLGGSLPESVAQQHSPDRQLMKTVLGTCYEVDPDFVPAIEKAVQALRSEIRSKAKDKLIVYISVPLTSRGGGYRPLNVEISDFLKARVERRFEGQVWALAPGKTESELPAVKGKNAQGGEYMYMWTQVLAGEAGDGKDFSLLYAAGPSEIGDFFGSADDISSALEHYISDRIKWDQEFRNQIASDPEFKPRFKKYYAMKASVAFSDGSHDEWNIFQEINSRRRAVTAFGIGEQIPVYYDGRSASPAEMETKVTPGYEKRCPR